MSVTWKAPGADLMSAYEPHIGARSEVTGRTAQSPRVKRSTVSHEFSETNACGIKLKLKDDNYFRLILENTNDLPPNMGHCLDSWKHK